MENTDLELEHEIRNLLNQYGISEKLIRLLKKHARKYGYPNLDFDKQLEIEAMLTTFMGNSFRFILAGIILQMRWEFESERSNLSLMGDL